ncbi:hypothetical protein [Legionella micdadei]|uniref:Putative Nucleotidyl transferase n=1 Tax=Legionella micdadei TaxID=451 RepID=A0A098GEN5_LEGMI|nr:hypothetical protein [Legionella micdadei]ARG98378.1 hypothetical protein B6N58_12285 [Legionella micdadei]ARH01128.1 hypothetical protein B6V88_12290 [Legionella micdadei]KTD27313.1 hypothetical protein Lmic_2248 [Legionella micdadei]NSL18697.1 hypothetical protein [Legionella micdadei]CEG59946.1 putative Nucleotidyl transferase [Legionella micdadei]
MRIVVIPMAGFGTRFLEIYPDKKLTPVPPNNEPMFIHAIHKLGFSYDKIILITREAESIQPVLMDYPLIASRATIVATHNETKGPLDTVMYAKSTLLENLGAELVICNCDQVLVWPGNWALSWLKDRGAVGGIPTIERKSQRHSYAEIDEKFPCKITRVREKERISNRATIGVYWFGTIADFLPAAEKVFMNKDVAPNGEYYVSHVYNYLDGLILEYPLCEFWSLGEPDNFNKYISKNYLLGEDI